MKKQPTKLDIFNVAAELIEDNGTTTSLEVKKALQAADYFASQELVGKQLAIIADEEGWDINVTNGKYRIYSFCDVELDEELDNLEDEDMFEIDDDDITIRNVKTAQIELDKVCYLADKHDFMEVVEWSNGDGYDVNIYRAREENQVTCYQFTCGEISALIALVCKLEDE